MAVTDELVLKVTWSEYERRVGVLDGKISEMRTLLGEYQELKNDAALKVLGRDDTNLAKLQDNIEKNVKAVEGQLNLLGESRKMLQKQMDNLELLSGDVGQTIDSAAQAAVSAFKTVKAVGDLVD